MTAARAGAVAEARHDGDFDGHVAEVTGRAEVGAGKRHGLARVARDGHADQVAVADDGVGGIELHPAGAGQVDLAPGVRRAAADVLRAVTAQGT